VNQEDEGQQQDSVKSSRLRLIDSAPLFSVVIPLAPNEQQWISLCQDFHLLPSGCEVILVTTKHRDISYTIGKLQKDLAHLHWSIVESEQGRALQLNKGACLAKNPFIWFLHADSRITQDNINSLLVLLNQADSNNYLIYFKLYFFDKTSTLLKLNEWGANIRSRFLGLPFGDQGFCLSRDAFKLLGGYNQEVQFGEDHLLVWQAKHQGITLKFSNSKLATSARKYQDKGWRYLTLKYQLLWPIQALPQLWQLLKIKLARNTLQ
jgi:hypothetical protein